jgi:Protein of unknown function (DUF998)
MAKPLLADRPITSFERSAAVASFVAGCLFAFLLLGLHLVEPEFDPTWRFVSEYALGGAGWMMTVAFISLAISLLSAALSVMRHVRTVFGYIGLVILVVAAGGFLLAAAFQTDPITTAADAYTFSGRMHVLGASLDYSPVGMLLTGWALSRTDDWRSLRRPLMITASIAFLIMIGFTATLPRDSHFGPGVYTGLIGRIMLLSYVGWIMAVSTCLRTVSCTASQDNVRLQVSAGARQDKRNKSHEDVAAEFGARCRP